jgi:hypothetical protein
MDVAQTTAQAEEASRLEAERRNADGDAAEETDSTASLDPRSLVVEHPVAALVTALGLGYVLGGGLFAPVTRRLLVTGMRLSLQFAVLPAVEREVAGLAGSFGTALRGGAAADAPDTGDYDLDDVES